MWTVCPEERAGNSPTEHLRRERARRLAEQRTPLESVNPAPQDVVRINAGGTLIETSRATLTKIKGSLLADMWSGDGEFTPRADSAGAFFIERPAVPFSRLIDTTIALVKEFEFWKVPLPGAHVSSCPRSTSPS
mgnify:CR=1 FL=1